MKTAVRDMPHVTLHIRADASELLAWQADLAAGVAGRGPRVTITVLLMHLVAHALARYPRVNGRTEDGEIRLYDTVNLGVAVALDDGLVVPVVRDAHAKDLAELAAAIADLTTRARAGALRLPDLEEATFTLSNLGAYGVETFTPIINPPQLAILGVGAIRPELRFDAEGSVVAVEQLHLSMSFDHAAMDGAQAARFLQLLVRLVESPRALEAGGADEGDGASPP